MTNILVLTLLTISMAANASVKVIYGEDNRVDLFEETDQTLLELARSTAAMVPNRNLIQINDYETKMGGGTLAGMGICKSERFAQQPSSANCSGFLVDGNKLVTAGHCIRTQRDCEGNSWVFDYKVEYSDQSEVIVENSKIFKCKRIISQSLDSWTKDDYALLELEEIVTDREPLEFRVKGEPKRGDNLVIIGHPSGLPTKIAAGAQVRNVNNVYFTANLDAFGGNSGSAVFNLDTGVVEGILVRGDTDFVYDSAQGCRVSNVIGNNAGRGEDVTLITNIKELAQIAAGRGRGDNGDDNNDDDNSDDDGNDEEPEDPYANWPAWLRWLLGV